MTTADTRRLASARFEVVSDAHARRLTRSALVVSLALVALLAGLRLLADGAAVADQRTRLQQQNAALQAEVTKLETELELERATHAGLDVQVGELNQQVADLERQLAFVNAQRARTRAATPSN